MEKVSFAFLVALFWMISPPSYAQNEGVDSVTTITENRKLTKEEKKEAKWAKREKKELRKSERKFEELQRREVNYVLIKNIVQDSAYVLEATTLYNRYGRSIPVSSSINFLAVSGDSLILQIGSDFGLGPNGVGGVTLEGRILKYEVTEEPGHGNVSVNINVKSAILGLATVLIKVSDTGSFRSTVRGSWRQEITMTGNFKTWESSKIFKGRTTRSRFGPY